MKRHAAKRNYWRTGAVVAALVATSFLGTLPAQVPLQDVQPAGSALRPAVMGPSGGVSTGHPLTTAAAFGILLKGGNAFDAGVASILAGGVLEQDLYSLGGEALVLVYPKKEGKVTSIVGQGWAPRAVDVDWYLTRQKTLQGEGLDPAVVPGALHAALTVLERWGTMRFEDVVAPAIGYAEHGFPMRPSTARAIENELTFFGRWPANKAYWLKPDGSLYKAGETIKLPTLARTLRRMVEAERGAKARDAPPASSRRAIVSTRGTSPARWWRFCASTTRRSTKATSRSTSPGSRNRRGPPTAATPCTSTGSAVKVPCCCRRSTFSSSSISARWAMRARTTSTRLSRR